MTYQLWFVILKVHFRAAIEEHYEKSSEFDEFSNWDWSAAFLLPELTQSCIVFLTNILLCFFCSPITKALFKLQIFIIYRYFMLFEQSHRQPCDPMWGVPIHWLNQSDTFLFGDHTAMSPCTLSLDQLITDSHFLFKAFLEHVFQCFGCEKGEIFLPLIQATDFHYSFCFVLKYPRHYSS